MKQVLLLFFIIVLLNLAAAGDFSANSFIVQYQGVSGTSQFLREYSANGTKLQDIALPNRGITVAGFNPRLDTSGTLLLIQMQESDGAGGFNSYIYTMNSKGQIVDTTSFYSGTSSTRDAAMNGSDIWTTYSYYVTYIQKGSTAVTTNNIATTSNTLKSGVQLVGTRLYVIEGADLKYMDPVITTGTSALTAVTNVGITNKFLFHKPDILYTQSSSGVVKYSVTDGQATQLSTLSLTTSGAIIYRYTDDGANGFINKVTIYDGSERMFSIGPSPKLTCSDGFLNQDETDIDCGGATCSGCENTKTCSVDSDCSSSYCTSGKVCDTPTCSDNVKNGKETDKDCGGPDCSTCAFEKSCKVNTDCLGGLCDALVCAASCTDTVQNQQETDVDCGGPHCSACVDNKKCLNNTDCSSNYCNPDFMCSTPSCSDHFMNQDETDVDCGGNSCPKCAESLKCNINSDCTSDYCNPLHNCSIPTCSDGFKNNDETDIDCGGTTCSACANDKACVKNSDCESNTCTGNICVNPPVAPPVDAPITAPLSDQPQSSAPSDSAPTAAAPKSSTPVKQKGVSGGAVVELSLVSLLVGLSALILL